MDYDGKEDFKENTDLSDHVGGITERSCLTEDSKSTQSLNYGFMKSASPVFPNSRKFIPGDTKDEEHVKYQPLKDRYRLRKQCADRIPFFAPLVSNAADYVWVLMDFFNNFQNVLREAQARCLSKLQWGKPVVVGRHWSRTIDKKMQGRPSLSPQVSSGDESSSEGGMDEASEVSEETKLSKVSHNENENRSSRVSPTSTKPWPGCDVEDVVSDDVHPDSTQKSSLLNMQPDYFSDAEDTPSLLPSLKTPRMFVHVYDTLTEDINMDDSLAASPPSLSERLYPETLASPKNREDVVDIESKIKENILDEKIHFDESLPNFSSSSMLQCDKIVLPIRQLAADSSDSDLSQTNETELETTDVKICMDVLPHSRLRTRKNYRNLAENEPDIKRVKMSKGRSCYVECPLCCKSFPMKIIEQHAAKCGLIPLVDLEEKSEITKEAFSESSQDRYICADTGNIPDKEVTKGSLEEFCQTLKTNEIPSSGNLIECYICERSYREERYEAHLKRCLKQSEELQKEFDSFGDRSTLEFCLEQVDTAQK